MLHIACFTLRASHANHVKHTWDKGYAGGYTPFFQPESGITRDSLRTQSGLSQDSVGKTQEHARTTKHLQPKR